MPKYYTTLKVSKEFHKKLIKARGKLELKTGEYHSLERVLDVALNLLLAS
jgi:hypothetical protein